MAQPSSNKRPSKTAGVKALIASASVAATIAGWAMLPSNDPTSVSAAGDPAGQQPALTAPNGADPGTTNAPTTSAPDNSLPQVQVPQGFSNFPSPLTNTHSSR